MNTKAISKKNGHNLNGFSTEAIGDDHLFTSLETPMKANAFDMSNEEKKNRISILFSENDSVFLVTKIRRDNGGTHI